METVVLISSNGVCCFRPEKHKVLLGRPGKTVDLECSKSLAGLLKLLWRREGTYLDVVTDLAIGQGKGGDAWTAYPIHDHPCTLIIGFGKIIKSSGL